MKCAGVGVKIKRTNRNDLMVKHCLTKNRNIMTTKTEKKQMETKDDKKCCDQSNAKECKSADSNKKSDEKSDKKSDEKSAMK